MPQFVLMLRDSGQFPEDITAEEVEKIIARYSDWMERMGGTGEKLRDGEGRVIVRRDGGIAVTDGPFAEAREIIGGYMVIEAASYDEAIQKCHDSPHLDFGSIEVREIEPH